MRAAKAGRARAKRGRPPKFGRRGRVVAVTLPEEIVRRLKRDHTDLGWAIVRLFEQRSPERRRAPRSADGDSALVDVAHGRSLIVVNRGVFKDFPGINLLPLYGDRALLALDPETGIADLELAVIDRMGNRSVRARERTALARLRAQLRRWRTNPALRCTMRSIIVVEQAPR